MKSHSTIRYWICYLLLFVVLLVLFVGTLCTGSVPFSLSEIGSVLMHPEQNTTAWKILWEIRMPGDYFRRSTFCFWLLAANILFESDCRAVYLGDFLRCKADRCLGNDFFLGTGEIAFCNGIDWRCLFWVYALYGVYPVDFWESSSNVYSDYLWGYDWLYLFCNH